MALRAEGALLLLLVSAPTAGRGQAWAPEGTGQAWAPEGAGWAPTRPLPEPPHPPAGRSPWAPGAGEGRAGGGALGPWGRGTRAATRPPLGAGRAPAPRPSVLRSGGAEGRERAHLPGELRFVLSPAGPGGRGRRPPSRLRSSSRPPGALGAAGRRPGHPDSGPRGFLDGSDSQAKRTSETFLTKLLLITCITTFKTTHTRLVLTDQT